MIFSIAVSALLAAVTPMQPANPACAVLTAPDVTSLLGAGAKAIGISSAPNGASCMYQNGEKVATIVMAMQTSAESALRLWTSKKRIVQGTDIEGWGASAYAGALGTAPAVGIAKGSTFVEVRVSDKTAKTEELAKRLRASMKSVASRM